MRHKDGFTLIEILVAITIIFVLISILLPVIRETRQRAYRATCISNMRQIGLALHQYAQDWEGCVPPFTTHKHRTVQDQRFDPFIIIDLNPFNDPTALKLCFSTYGVSDCMWHCPLDPKGSSSRDAKVNLTDTSYYIDFKFTLWRPVALDNPPMVPLERWKSDPSSYPLYLFWTDSDKIREGAPTYLSCDEHAFKEHAILFLRFDGSVGKGDTRSRNF